MRHFSYFMLFCRIFYKVLAMTNVNHTLICHKLFAHTHTKTQYGKLHAIPPRTKHIDDLILFNKADYWILFFIFLYFTHILLFVYSSVLNVVLYLLYAKRIPYWIVKKKSCEFFHL